MVAGIATMWRACKVPRLQGAAPARCRACKVPQFLPPWWQCLPALWQPVRRQASGALSVSGAMLWSSRFFFSSYTLFCSRCAAQRLCDLCGPGCWSTMIHRCSPDVHQPSSCSTCAACWTACWLVLLLVSAMPCGCPSLAPGSCDVWFSLSFLVVHLAGLQRACQELVAFALKVGPFPQSACGLAT